MFLTARYGIKQLQYVKKKLETKFKIGQDEMKTKLVVHPFGCARDSKSLDNHVCRARCIVQGMRFQKVQRQTY